jgi:uncharacterized protein (DUF488 family)
MPELFSIGHSNHALETFLALLQQHVIGCVADVRSHPFSGYSPHFDAPNLKAALREAGIAYVPLGRELGGRPDEEAMYDPAGHVLYGRVAESEIFREGIARVERGSREHRVAMMCSEENPADCHRHLLVARVLAERGTAVTHIRGDGRMEAYEDVERERTGNSREKQSLLFPELEEDAWRSIRSVSPKSRPRSSSGS